jgi:hypothetical protein
VGIRHQGIGGRHEERFGDTEQRPAGQQESPVGRKAGEERKCAPHCEAADDQVRLGPAVSQEAGDGRADAVYPEEKSAGEAENRIAEAEFLLQGREQGVDDLPVSLIQDVGDPEECD